MTDQPKENTMNNLNANRLLLIGALVCFIICALAGFNLFDLSVFNGVLALGLALYIGSLLA